MTESVLREGGWMWMGQKGEERPEEGWEGGENSTVQLRSVMDRKGHFLIFAPCRLKGEKGPCY